MSDYDMEPGDRAKLRVRTKLPYPEYTIYHEVREKLAAARGLAWELHDNMRNALWDITQQYRTTLAGIAEHKKEYDAILHEYGTVHNMEDRAHDLALIVKWPEIFAHPHITLSDNKHGWRVDVQPEATNRLYYSDWIERIATGRTFWGVNGLPNDPAGIYPRPHLSGSTESQQQEQDGTQQQEQQEQREQAQQKQASSTEAGPSRPPPQSPPALALLGSHLPPEHTGFPSEGPSDTNTRPTKLDKGKGKAVDTPHKNNITTIATISGSSSTSATGSVPALTIAVPPSTNDTRPTKLDKGKGNAVDIPSSNTTAATAGTVTIESSSTAVGSPSTSAALPVSASDPFIAKPSSTGNSIDNLASTTSNKSSTTDSNSTTTIMPTPTRKGESDQEAVSNDAKDKSTANVQRRATKIKIITPGSKKDVKGKGKAVDPPSHNNNNSHKITKPSGSKEPAVVATNRIIKRSQVVKGKYWAFKLDSSMFTKDGRIRAEFSNDKGNNKSLAKEKVRPTVSDSANDNGEGSSSMASSSKTATAINNGNDDNSDDELALGRESDDYDSGSETDNSKDSTFTLTSKSKKGKVTAAAAAAAATTASSSDSSSNKRKRATTDTGDEEGNAYYVLCCPLDRNCMSQSDSTHNDPEDIKGIFCRHPFKRRRAINHMETCQLDEELRSERQIWENCCLRVVPDRKNTPVNDEWAMRHNTTLIRSLVHKAGVEKGQGRRWKGS
ncbi:hypothetical protein B0T13DRAFT_445646 [Neurospora crassa]|nr:hypothetical protein B0T13DRAFT_445646 [Neurospora crassa]